MTERFKGMMGCIRKVYEPFSGKSYYFFTVKNTSNKEN